MHPIICRGVWLLPLVVATLIIIVPLIIIILVPLEGSAPVVWLPLILCLPALPGRSVHVIRGLVVVQAEILRGRDAHAILIVILPGVICSTSRVILVGICLPGVAPGSNRIIR